jgi:hypothetical protein
MAPARLADISVCGSRAQARMSAWLALVAQRAKIAGLYDNVVPVAAKTPAFA